MLQWLPLLAVPIIGGYLLWGKYRSRQRGPAVARFASQHSLSYSAAGYVDSPGYDFPLLRAGDHCGYENVLAGRWQGLPVKEADYWWYTTMGTGHTEASRPYFSIVVADLAATMPYVSVQTKDMLTRAFEHVGLPTLPDISFESADVIGFEPEDFNQKFQVAASDEEFAIKLIDAGMIGWLLSTGGEFAFEVGGCNLLVSCGQLPVTSLVQLFDAAKGFVDHIPHVVWAEYGDQGANSHDGGPPGTDGTNGPPQHPRP